MQAPRTWPQNPRHAGDSMSNARRPPRTTGRAGDPPTIAALFVLLRVPTAASESYPEQLCEQQHLLLVLR
jgi:hypothetical protein